MTGGSIGTGKLTVKAYRGDAKTLLAFNLDMADTQNLAGFTIACMPDGSPSYYIHNELQFKDPTAHAQDSNEPPNSSINAPIHKFRWVHVPGSVHQGLTPFMGKYTYTVTPRYFDDKNSLLPLDASLSQTAVVDVVPFVKGAIQLGFARGFTQSQAFVHHFGKHARIQPKTKELLFDTSQISGANDQGQKYTFAEEYDWLGFTARARIFELLNEVLQENSLHLDMFAYDLNEPDFMKIVLELARQGRVRVILDNAALHHNAQRSKPEDQFEDAFNQKKQGNAEIQRGKFGRYSHDKVLIVSDAQGAHKLLTGSTNFSVTGIYVNSNHVLVFDQDEIAAAYSKVFEESWNDKQSMTAFRKSSLATAAFTPSAAATPPMSVNFSPHSANDATAVLTGIKNRIDKEGAKAAGGSLFFAVMEIDNGTSPVYQALKDIHQNQNIFSYGISDGPGGINLYKPGTRQGLLVSGKPASTVLPPPFDQVPGMGLGHQVHHKFVVCGFNQPDAVVYCGSSNLAVGGEEENGDNLLEIHDTEVATVFAIEAVGLVDHFNFLDKCTKTAKSAPVSGAKVADSQTPPASMNAAAVSAGWFLSINDNWVKPYYDPADIKCADRILFG